MGSAPGDLVSRPIGGRHERPRARPCLNIEFIDRVLARGTNLRPSPSLERKCWSHVPGDLVAGVLATPRSASGGRPQIVPKVAKMLQDPMAPESDVAAFLRQSSPGSGNDVLVRRVRQMFGGATELMADETFMSGLRLWLAKVKCTNMHLERHLAHMKASLQGLAENSPDAERLVSVGFLGELLTSHKRHGGTACRVVSRKEVMAAGAPPRAATKKASGRSRPPSGFLLFRQHKQKQLRESIGRRLTKEECQAALAGATRAWKRDLSDAETIHTGRSAADRQRDARP